ncbi:DUF3408 domain-containing protein [Rikenella microfusus]
MTDFIFDHYEWFLIFGAVLAACFFFLVIRTIVLAVRAMRRDERCKRLAPLIPLRPDVGYDAQQAYNLRFLKTALCRRQCVYIDKELHAKIIALLGVSYVKGSTVGGFVDNVLREHFERHEGVIRERFKDGCNDLA